MKPSELFQGSCPVTQYSGSGALVDTQVNRELNPKLSLGKESQRPCSQSRPLPTGQKRRTHGWLRFPCFYWLFRKKTCCLSYKSYFFDSSLGTEFVGDTYTFIDMITLSTPPPYSYPYLSIILAVTSLKNFLRAFEEMKVY